MATQHRTVFALSCDACEAVASADWMDLDATLADAQQQGWQVGDYQGGDDLCPTCWAQREAEYAEHERQRLYEQYERERREALEALVE